MRKAQLGRMLVLVGLGSLLQACAPAIRSTAKAPLTSSQMTEFWQDVDPAERGDLRHGVGGRRLQPDPNVVYEAIQKDTSGFSDGYDVRDPKGLEWSVKIGDEAQSEVVASRLVWAMGYHQPPVYYLPQWRVRYAGRVLREGPGRFRPKLSTLENVGDWSWHQNPFVGSQPYRGLLVLMMIINSTDLKQSNNALYEKREDGRRVERWYTVKDLGASFGTTGVLYPKRNDIGSFEEHQFVDYVSDDGRVRFAYRGRHDEILRELAVPDVRWMCDRLALLSNDQWNQIFEAAGHPPEITRRYIAKLQAKIAEGRALGSRTARRGE